ncbi:hypothetical protein KAF25_007909 [Fusarium avenaceum]|uniref:Integral membrane protein n=1 Tax=Fusarium avenaceum TaxID=40199 RepID=A0A9P7GWN5_9HYPO|nr:hypothetical protein KAF25_007909 [Fusarium avenaceum]
MGISRFIGVLLPFTLAIASTIFVLVPALAGVTDKSLYIFQLNVENLSISPASDLIEKLETRADIISKNITADVLGLDKTYDITLWGYCHTDKDGKRECSKPKFDWVRKTMTDKYLEDADKSVKTKLPREIKTAITAFGGMTRAAEVAYIVALLELAIQVALGIFAVCSRELTCWTWMISGLASAFVLASAILTTVMASISIGAVESTAKLYGVRGEINIVFLAIIWIGAILAIAANLLWILPTLCCKPKRRTSEDKGLLDRSSQFGAYAPIDDGHEMQPTYYNHGGTPSLSTDTRADLAYEPYTPQV